MVFTMEMAKSIESEVSCLFQVKLVAKKNTAWDLLGPIPHCLSSMISLSDETYKYFGPDRKNIVFSFLNNILFWFMPKEIYAV